MNMRSTVQTGQTHLCVLLILGDGLRDEESATTPMGRCDTITHHVFYSTQKILENHAVNGRLLVLCLVHRAANFTTAVIDNFSQIS